MSTTQNEEEKNITVDVKEEEKESKEEAKDSNEEEEEDSEEEEQHSNVNNAQQQQPSIEEETEFDRRMKNFPPNHKFVFPKITLTMKAKRLLKMGNEYITEFVNGSTSSFDLIISNSDFHPLVKRILHAKQILFIVFIVNTHFLLNSVLIPHGLSLSLTISLILMILSIAVLVGHSYFTKSLYLDKDQDVENFIVNKNPELKKNMCSQCDVIKTMRCMHCYHCNKCILKYNFHSDWFNICIGASNELLYLITFLFVMIYFTIVLITFIYDIFFNGDNNEGVQFQLHLWFIIFCYVFYCGGYFYYELIKNSLRNLTMYEYKNQRHLTYLFKDYSKALYNPFDKGASLNIKEMLINTLPFFDKKEPKVINGNIPLPSDEENSINPQPEQQAQDVEMQGELGAFKMFIELNREYPPFSSVNGHIVKKIKEGEMINWNIIRIYTIFDIENCPFKNILVSQAEETLRKYPVMAGNRNINKSI